MANKHRRRELDASIAERQIPITNSRRIRQEEAENIAAEYRAKRELGGEGWEASMCRDVTSRAYLPFVRNCISYNLRAIT